jgi:DNA-binding transcriptional LysR family regulator
MATSIRGRNIHFTALRYFYEVAQAGSFRGAADALHVAASAVNRQVQILEQGFGCALFDRARGRAGISLTAAGRILLNDVQSAMDSIEHACDEITALHGLRRGHVEVGVNEGFTSSFFPKFLARFREEHPQITFNLWVDASPNLNEMVMDNRLEIAVAYNPPARFGLEVLAEFEVDTMVMMHRDHPLAAKAELTVSDLAGQDLLLPAMGVASRSYLDNMLVAKNVRTRTVLTTNSYNMRLQAVREKLGIVVMCFHPVHRLECGPEAVLRVLREPSAPAQRLMVYKKKGRELTPASLLLAAQLTSALEAGAELEAQDADSGTAA